jgi:protein phosphatase
MPAAVAALEQAAARGLDVSELLAQQSARAVNAEAFSAAYRHYVWPTAGLEGVRLAPFQVLAAEGAVLVERDHGWHLALIDRLVAVDPVLFKETARLIVDVTDADSLARGVAWWEALTAVGGEGMVVKPLGGVTRGKKGLVQPGLKVRGREYLRIIYGPNYTEPANLVRLRNRSLGHKRSLALREWALGVEAGRWPANRCGGCTRRSSPCWRWRASRSTEVADHTRVAGCLLISSPQSVQG